MVIFRVFFCINIGSHLGFLTALGNPKVEKCGSLWILFGAYQRIFVPIFMFLPDFAHPKQLDPSLLSFFVWHVTYLQKGAITPLVFVQLCCDFTYFIKISYEMTFWLENSYTFIFFENIHCPFLKNVRIVHGVLFSGWISFGMGYLLNLGLIVWAVWTFLS